MLGKFARLYADRSHNYSIASVASLKSNTFQVMPLERRGGLPVGRCQVEVFCGVFQLWFEAKLEEKTPAYTLEPLEDPLLTILAVPLHTATAKVHALLRKGQDEDMVEIVGWGPAGVALAGNIPLANDDQVELSVNTRSRVVTFPCSVIQVVARKPGSQERLVILKNNPTARLALAHWQSFINQSHGN